MMNKTGDDTALLTAEEVSERLHCSTAQVRIMLESGRLRGIRLGSQKGHWRVAPAELQRFITNSPLEPGVE